MHLNIMPQIEAAIDKAGLPSGFTKDHPEFDGVTGDLRILRFAYVPWDNLPGFSSAEAKAMKGNRALLFEIVFTKSDGTRFQMVLNPFGNKPGNQLIRKRYFDALSDHGIPALKKDMKDWTQFARLEIPVDGDVDQIATVIAKHFLKFLVVQMLEANVPLMALLAGTPHTQEAID